MKESIASLARPDSRDTKKCQLCNMEKTLIACQDQEKALNRRGELMTRCRHRDKHILTNWVTQHHPQLEDDDQVAPHVPTEHDEADVTEEHHLLQQPEHLSTEDQEEGFLDDADVPTLATEEHHLLQQPGQHPAEGDDDDHQTEGGPMTRSRTRARNKNML